MMSKKEEQFYMVNKFLRYRNDVIKYIWSTICLVIILSLLSNAVIILFSKYALFIVVSSIFALSWVLFFLYFRGVLPFLDQEKEYRGNVFYNKESKKILTPQGYFFSDRIKDYMEGILAEDKEIARRWKKSSLNPQHTTNCFGVLKQAVDYYLITSLESILYEFFDNYSDNHKDEIFGKIKRYKRQDLLPFFGENKFFNLFTKSMGRRESFKDGHELGIGRGRKMHYARAFNGAYYDYFEMPLPISAVISQDPNDSDILIIIKTPQLELRIWRRVYIGERCVPLDMFLYSNSLPDGYLDIDAIDINIKIQVKFNRWRSLFSLKMDDYKWVDKFNIDLEKYIDINQFKSEMKHKSYEYLFEKILNMENKIKKDLQDIRIGNKKTRRIHY